MRQRDLLHARPILRCVCARKCVRAFECVLACACVRACANFGGRVVRPVNRLMGPPETRYLDVVHTLKYACLGQTFAFRRSDQRRRGTNSSSLSVPTLRGKCAAVADGHAVARAQSQASMTGESELLSIKSLS